MTGDIGTILASVLAGAVIGGIYLGLLRLAVHALTHRQSALIFVALGIVRAALVIGAIAMALSFDVPLMGILAALAGFTAVRCVLTRAANPIAGAIPWK